MIKPAFCNCENNDADQLRDNREADQRLCFRYTGSTIPLLPKSEITSFWPSSVTVQPEDRFSHYEAHLWRTITEPHLAKTYFRIV